MILAQTGYQFLKEKKDKKEKKYEKIRICKEAKYYREWKLKKYHVIR